MGSSRALGEARGGPRHTGKQTDPDGGTAQRTGPTRLPSAKTALRGRGSGAISLLCDPCKQTAGGGSWAWASAVEAPGVQASPAQLPAADALGQGNEDAGPGHRAQFPPPG